MFARAGVFHCPWLKLLWPGVVAMVGRTARARACSGLPHVGGCVLRSGSDRDRLAKTGLTGCVAAPESDMRRPALVVALGLVLLACSGSAEDKRAIWNGDSAGIEFELTGATGQRICEFSAAREELTEAQLDGLASLRLQDAAVRAGCDTPTYSVTIRAGDGSSVDYRATHVDCSASPILLFEDFDAWAKSSPCSL